MKANPRHVVAGVLILLAAGVAYLATRTAGNVQQNPYTETVRGPLQKQVLTVDELNMSRTFEWPNYPMRYPGQVAAGVSRLVSLGFAPLWQPGDPQIAALPAEQGP